MIRKVFLFFTIQMMSVSIWAAWLLCRCPYARSLSCRLLLLMLLPEIIMDM